MAVALLVMAFALPTLLFAYVHADPLGGASSTNNCGTVEPDSLLCLYDLFSECTPDPACATDGSTTPGVRSTSTPRAGS